MSFTIAKVEENLVGMAHGSTLNKVRNKLAMYERVANNIITNVDMLEAIVNTPLGDTVNDIQNNFDLPADYNKLIDLYPQANRTNIDQGRRHLAEKFDLTKAIRDKQLSIESEGGTKYLRLDWATRSAKVLSNMDTFDGNGTWIKVATASGVETDKIIKFSGGGSVKFDSAASDDGIQNTTMTEVDMTNEDDVADCYVKFYIKDTDDLANLNSATVLWGNDLTTNFWTGVTQTAQEDGTAFRVGWNRLKIPWSTATESGTVDPAAIDSFKITFDTDGAISDIRVDEIKFAIGLPFDIKYYSKFLFKNTTGARITQPTTTDDVVVLDNDNINIFLYECLIEMAQQMEGTDSAFDMQFAFDKLHGIGNTTGLYQKYRREHPSQAKKARQNYGKLPNFRNNRGGFRASR